MTGWNEYLKIGVISYSRRKFLISSIMKLILIAYKVIALFTLPPEFIVPLARAYSSYQTEEEYQFRLDLQEILLLVQVQLVGMKI